MTGQMEFNVEWNAEITASDPVEAAQDFLSYVAEGQIGRGFHVTNLYTGEVTYLDLDDLTVCPHCDKRAVIVMEHAEQSSGEVYDSKCLACGLLVATGEVDYDEPYDDEDAENYTLLEVTPEDDGGVTVCFNCGRADEVEEDERGLHYCRRCDLWLDHLTEDCDECLSESTLKEDARNRAAGIEPAAGLPEADHYVCTACHRIDFGIGYQQTITEHGKTTTEGPLCADCIVAANAEGNSNADTPQPTIIQDFGATPTSQKDALVAIVAEDVELLTAALEGMADSIEAEDEDAASRLREYAIVIAEAGMAANDEGSQE